MSTNPAITHEKRSDFVKSLERGLAVIRAFDSPQRELTLTEVARTAGLTRAAARRFLLTLVKLGYVEAGDGRFWLRPRVLDLGHAYLSGLGVLDVAQPHLEALGGRLGESSSIAVLDDIEIVYLMPTRRVIRIKQAVGSRLPAYATAMGRILLAGLPDRELTERVSRIALEPLTARTIADPDRLLEAVRSARSRGYTLVDQELEEGIRALAVPIRNQPGAVVAAINLAVHAGRISTAVLEHDFLPLLQETAAGIERELHTS